MTTSTDIRFTADDDGLHPAGDDFYQTETFWFSFFIPERDMGAWVYVSVRPNAGVTAGGLWLWDGTSALPWDIPFYESYSALKPARFDGTTLHSPTGATIRTTEPGRAYDIRFSDRDRISVELTFEGLEDPVPLQQGAPPYPAASHYDQTGHVTGSLNLDGQSIEIDCYAMRDRSWGSRHERGYQRVGYTWLASPQCSLLTYSAPTSTSDDIHSGYIRIGSDVHKIVEGRRTVARDPAQAWIDELTIAVIDDRGKEFAVHGTSRSRLVLPGSTSVCVNSLLEFDLNGDKVYGEDQDVWPIKEFRQARQLP